MKKGITALVVLIIAIVYVILVNYLSGININFLFHPMNITEQIPEGCNMINESFYECPYESSGTIQKIGLSGQASFQIERNRWYGVIYEDGNNKILYIFKQIRFPLKSKETNYVPAHIFFLILVLVVSIVMSLPRDTNLYKDQKT